MTILGKRVQLPIVPAVNPEDDATNLDTVFFTDADKIRFQNGKLRKIKGCSRIFSQNNQRILGAARNIFSYRDGSNYPISIVGTHESLYAIEQGVNFYNITPIQTATNAVPNCFTTEYNEGVVVPVTTTLGSNVVTMNITQYLNDNDDIEISGVSVAVNGIPAANFNNTFNTYVIDRNNIQFVVATAATSSGTQNVTMNWATSYLYLNIYNNGVTQWSRIKILASGNVANILAAAINGENVVSNVVNLSEFVIQTDTMATSYVTGAGGSDTTIQYQIASGNIDQSIGYGYGGGQYGAGIYGAQAAFTNQYSNTYPRIWSMDKWVSTSGAVYVVLTPGDTVGSADGSGANVYAWNGDIDVAPTLIENAPSFVSWLYVSHNAICTLGGAFSPAVLGTPNFIATSDVADMTIWTPGAANYAYNTTLDNANALISQATTRGSDMLFTLDEVYLGRFVGKPNIWEFTKLMTTDGIIGPKARVQVEDAVLWQGQGDFFIFDGTSTVSVIPNNTLKRTVFDNINDAQSTKSFAYLNTTFNEAWFFYPSGQDIEPNNYAMYNWEEKVWAMGTWGRTAAEEPFNVINTPLMIQSNINANIIPDSINSYFLSFGNNPFTTLGGTKNIVFTNNTGCYLQVGDYIQVSGSTSINGIPATEINGIKEIIGVVDTTSPGYGVGFYGYGEYGASVAGSEQIVIQSVTTDSSTTGAGGGSGITIGTAVLGIDIGNTRIEPNETITITGAPGVGGISQAYINVSNSRVRAISGTVLQVNDAAPTTQFATSSQTILNNEAPEWAISYTPSDRLFQQEVGWDDYNPAYVFGLSGSSPLAPMLSFATTNMAQIGEGDDTMVIYSVYPDTNQSGNLTLSVVGKLYAQSDPIYPPLGGPDGTFTITPETTKVDIMMVARERQYTITSNVLGGSFLIGKWFEEIKPSSTR